MQTYEEIMAQIAELKAQAEDQRKKELADVLSEIKAKISQHGLTRADIFGGSGKVRKPVAAKYRDSADNTWSGRGKRPKWLTTAIAEGATLEQFGV